MEQTIVINRQPEIKNMVSASRYIFLTMPFFKIVCGMAIFIFVVNLIGLNATENKVLAASDWLGYLSFVLIWAFILFMMDRAIRKSITNNPKNLEPQILTFSQNSLVTEGQTYKVEYPWANIIKIKETKRWFLIYISKNSALPVEKENLTDNQYNELKKLLASLNVKKNLLA